MQENVNNEQSWLERMHAYLTWKVVGFDFKNPYERKVSDKALEELSRDLDALRKVVRARGLMDGEEIIVIKNLKELVIQTDHPSLSKLRKAELERYLDKCGVRDLFEKQLLVIQEECRSELEARRAAAKSKRQVS